MCKLKLSLTTLAVIAVLTAFVPIQNQQTDINEIHRLYLEDQRDRGVGGESLPYEAMNAHDKTRRDKVRGLLGSGQIKIAADFHDAAFIFQHGQDPSDYLLAHILAVASIEKGGSDSLWISAATLDRYLQAIHQPQIFGTQFSQEESKPYTQEPFNPQLLPDALRKQFCVSSLEQQKQKIPFFEAGKYPPNLNPPGCSR
jgi:hypothetical protein